MQRWLRALVDRWHLEIIRGIDVDAAVSGTAGLSFAEIEEVKNLLILHYLDKQVWDWDWATEQFRENRKELALVERQVGFVPLLPSANGNCEQRV